VGDIQDNDEDEDNEGEVECSNRTISREQQSLQDSSENEKTELNDVLDKLEQSRYELE